MAGVWGEERVRGGMSEGGFVKDDGLRFGGSGLKIKVKDLEFRVKGRYSARDLKPSKIMVRELEIEV